MQLRGVEIYAVNLRLRRSRKMAHECPECYLVCYCGGDIDDCCNNNPRDIENCKHCGEVIETIYDEDIFEHEIPYMPTGLKMLWIKFKWNWWAIWQNFKFRRSSR